ncbi:MAG TPA: type II toxin-antitoxin system VapB family antitoxin [Thermoanaerobaculia bacterium]|nr:type II toxin-antitoxin system VapB family antitoxin [Thermoanaerobaculia bacterium]
MILDEKLLEDARRISGEKTYSATITKALQDVVSQKRFWEAYKEFEKLAHDGKAFWDDYLEEIRPPGRMTRLQKKTRVAAHTKIAPRKKSRAGRTR